MRSSEAGPSRPRQSPSSPQAAPNLAHSHMAADVGGAEAKSSCLEDDIVTPHSSKQPAPWVFDQQPPEAERGCTFSPQGELLIGGLGIDGRNTRTGESGWASPAHTSRHAFRAWGTGDCRRGADTVASPSCNRSSTGFSTCSPRPSCVASSKNSAAGCGSAQGLPGYAFRGVWKRVALAAQLGRQPVVDEENPSVLGEAPALSSTNASRPAVMVEDMIEGRTCQPISLSDFRKYLLRQRQSKGTSAAPLSFEPDFSILGGGLVQEKQRDVSMSTMSPDATFVGDDSVARGSDRRVALPPSSSHGTDGSLRSVKEQDVAGCVTGDEQGHGQGSAGDTLDALDFAVAVDRYVLSFSRLSSSARELAPMCEADAVEVLRDSVRDSTAQSDHRLCASGKQPLRKRFDNIVSTYVGSKDGRFQSTTPKLSWMRDTGLVSEALVAQTLEHASRTTHPDALLPLARAVQAHLDSHVLVDFLDSASHNLSRNTKWGRLVTGIACTIVALVLSILLIVEPSPLSPHFATDRSNAHLSRWWRFLTLPLWAAGIGSTLAAYTGVCVWLTLRGNHEPDKAVTEESKSDRPAHVIAASISGDHEKSRLDDGEHAGEADETGEKALHTQSWLMAPELKALLLRMIGQSAPKSSSEADNIKASALLPRTNLDSSALPGEPSRVYIADSPEGRAVPLAEPRRLSLGVRSSSTEPALAPVPSSRSFRLPGTQVSVGFLNARTALRTPTDAAASSTNIRFSTSTMVQLPADKPAATIPTLRSSSQAPLRKVVATLQQWTGFAVDTEPVLDERVRKIHQRAAINALAICTALTMVAIIIVLALP